MRILATGDNHFDEHSRFDECIRVHDWMIDKARELGVELFICAGDIYERRSTPSERNAVSSWLMRMATVCPVIVIKGNHDPVHELEILRRLETDHHVSVVESAEIVYVDGTAMACVAWPERANVTAWAREHGVAVEVAERDLLQAMLRGLGDELAAHDGPKFAAGHFMVDGSVASVGQPMLGHPLNVSLADLALLRAPLVLMGHIHAPQEWLHGDMFAMYTGSPYRTSFGEAEAKSVVLAESQADGTWGTRRIPTPCSGMELIEAEWDGVTMSITSQAYPHPERMRNAEVRLRYAVDADQRSPAKAAAETLRSQMISDGALSVKLEECVTATSRARAPEVALATGIDAKLRAYWAARNIDLPETRKAALVTHAQQLELES